MVSGVALGYIFRNRQINAIHKIITVLIWLLLFILGVEVGENREIVENLHSLGVEALIISVLSTLGSVVGAMFLWRWLKKSKNQKI